jgi:hypothetical protein
MRGLATLCLANSALWSTLATAGAVTVLGEPADHLQMVQISVEQQNSDDKLIGGNVATSEEYPGVFYTSQGGSRCTGTVIGSRVVASAAHCMRNGGSLTLTYKDVTYSGRCTHSPRYAGNSTPS